MKGYKAVSKERKSQYGNEFLVGETYTTTEDLKPGESGFHFCKRLEDTFFHFDMDKSIFYEIEVEEYVEYGEKCVTSKFTVLREIPRWELIEKCPNMYGLLNRIVGKLQKSLELCRNI